MTDTHSQKKHRILEGTVVSDKMQKTCVVAVTRMKKHPKYLKYAKVTTNFKVHDEENVAHTGDVVTIEESRPLSKDKRWTLKTIVKKNVAQAASPSEAKEE